MRSSVFCPAAPDSRAYLELCWHLGGAQTDIARLTAEDVDWQQNPIAYLAAILNLHDFVEELGGKWGCHWGEAIMLLGNDPGRCDLILKNLDPHTLTSECLKLANVVIGGRTVAA